MLTYLPHSNVFIRPQLHLMLEKGLLYHRYYTRNMSVYNIYDNIYGCMMILNLQPSVVDEGHVGPRVQLQLAQREGVNCSTQIGIIAEESQTAIHLY